MSGFFLLGQYREVEFVVHLQYHLALDMLCLETLEDVYHGYFDDVGGSTLDGSIDGVALGKAPDGGIG